MPFLDLPEVQLFYLQSGAGPDIVWIPGQAHLTYPAKTCKR